MEIDTLSGIGHGRPSQDAIPASESKWSFATKGGLWCSPAAANGVVSIGALGGFFYAPVAASGSEKWKLRTAQQLAAGDVRLDGAGWSLLRSRTTGWRILAAWTGNFLR
jgi:hypothetical protein